MYSLETIHAINNRPRIIRGNFNRDSSLCQSRRGYVIHSGAHRSTAFIDSTDHSESWQALTYWKGQGQKAINGFIESIISDSTLEGAELNAISRLHPEWEFTCTKYRGIVCTAVKRLAGFETRISAKNWKELNEKLS